MGTYCMGFSLCETIAPTLLSLRFALELGLGWFLASICLIFYLVRFVFCDRICILHGILPCVNSISKIGLEIEVGSGFCPVFD